MLKGEWDEAIAKSREGLKRKKDGTPRAARKPNADPAPAKPEGLVYEMGLPAHRAMPDAYVTAHHLRDMLNAVSLDQLIAWSLQPDMLPRVPAGAHRGRAWRDLDSDVLLAFATDRDVDVRFSAATELRRRGENPPARSLSPVQGQLV